MNVSPLLKELRHNPMLWLLALVPVVLAAAKLVPAAHTLLFVLSVLAIVPLAEENVIFRHYFAIRRGLGNSQPSR